MEYTENNLVSTDSQYATLIRLIDRLDSDAIHGTDIIPWGCPVPLFGDLSRPQVATLGINPSNREFVDKSGNELRGPFRRFHTLHSLGLETWSDIDARHLELILDTCKSYFFSNPYNAWFRRLDLVIAGARASYYDSTHNACHLDLIPFATTRKWTQLSTRQRSMLLAVSGNTLAILLRDSPVRILVLNGSSVVKGFEAIAGIRLTEEEVPAWTLGRQTGKDVAGLAYRGTVDALSGIGLGHEMLVLGFNHNLQGSFGVRTEIIAAIREWIARATNEVQW